jgi:hypothetical protein
MWRREQNVEQQQQKTKAPSGLVEVENLLCYSQFIGYKLIVEEFFPILLKDLKVFSNIVVYCQLCQHVKTPE